LRVRWDVTNRKQEIQLQECNAEEKEAVVKSIVIRSTTRSRWRDASEHKEKNIRQLYVSIYLRSQLQ